MTKFLHSWRGRLRRGSSAAPAAASHAISAQDLLCVEEVSAADFLAGALFRRKFHVPPPDFPIHFVSFYRAAPADVSVIGYVHFSEFEDSYLCGGLVIDDRLYRRMPIAHREAIRNAGGIAEHLLRAGFARLAHAAAIWGYVGDTRAERVDERVGFRRTDHPYVMVCWMRELSEADKRARLSRVIALGAF